MVTEYFERACAARSATFIEIPGGNSLSYEEANFRADALANALARIGVGKGDRVVTILDNGLTPIVLFLACLKTGSIYVPLNTTLKGQYLVREIASAEPKVISLKAIILILS